MSEESTMDNGRRHNVPLKTMEEDINSTTGERCSSQRHENNLLIVMDWDDTLFPTHAIGSILLDSTSEEEFVDEIYKNHLGLIEVLDAFSTKLYGFLTNVIQYHGAKNVFIITNSQRGWIDKCLTYSSIICDRFRSIYDLLFNEYEIEIVSAQSMFSAQLPYCAIKSPLAPLSWKQLTFCHLLKKYVLNNTNGDKIAPAQLVTIGDQTGDHHLANRAMRECADYKPLHHIIKCKVEPTIKELMNEISYMMAAFSLVLMQPQFMKALNERKSPQMLFDCEHMRFGSLQLKKSNRPNTNVSNIQKQI